MDQIGELSSSLEDYLKAILKISDKHQVARVKDIASALNVSKSSVTNALKNLASQDCVNYDPYSYVTLTDKGRELATGIFEKHQVLTQFLQQVLGVDEDSAEQNACRMEHIIDEDVFKRFVSFVEYMDKKPEMIADWTKNIQQFFSSEKVNTQ